MNKFVVVIPSYKNIKWYEKNITSALTQNFNNYRVIYTDDCSPDGTGDAVEAFLEKNNKKDLVTFIRNSERIGALENLYNMIHSCEDDEIIVTLDGDDWFFGPNVLRKLDQVYSDPNVWMTWGQYKNLDGSPGCSREIPRHVIASNSYRRYRWCSSHLRTFYTWLFKQIRKEDLLDKDGKFYPMGWDLVFMFPMLEMSGGRGRFIAEPLYVYNTDNPIQDWKTNIKLQQGTEMIIRKKPPYGRLAQKP